MSLPKIYIGIVTNKIKDYCVQQFALSIYEYDYPKENLIIGICDNSKLASVSKLPEILSQQGIKYRIFRYNAENSAPVRTIITNSRNILRNDFLKNSDCEYFFSLESDVILPPETLKTLLSYNKEIITAVNVHTYGPDCNKPIALTDEPISKTAIPSEKLIGMSRNLEWNDIYDFSSINPNELIDVNTLPEIKILKDPYEVTGCGLGCILIKREVLERIVFRVRLDRPVFDDMNFCNDAKELNYKIYLSPRIIAMHLQGGWEGLRK